MAKPKITSLVNIETLVEEYNTLREEKKRIESRMKTLSEDIKGYAETHGSKDDKGSFYCDSSSYSFGKVAKKSVSFITDKALSFFKTHNMHDAIKIVETIDEDAVEKYISDGSLSYSDLESITQTKTTYAVDVKKKEVVEDEVSETTIPIAASKKPVHKLKGRS